MDLTVESIHSIEHARRPAGQECAFILALNATAKPPRKAHTKARIPKEEAHRENEGISSDSDYDGRPVAKKISKPKAKKKITPGKAKKTPRAALVALDVNAPGSVQVCRCFSSNRV